MCLILREAARRGEIIRAAVADIGLRRLIVRLIRRRLYATRLCAAHSRRRQAALPRFGQQCAVGLRGFIVIASTEVMPANVAGAIDEIVRGPVLVVEGLPN